MNELITKLLNVPAKNRPIPFWSWNDHLDTEELKRQIHWMKEQGIGGFFMHARGGLKTKYLSDEWFEAVRVCCDEANRLGMNPWLYDENGWPSGFAGGKLLEKEENRDMYILETYGGYDDKADVSYLITDRKLIRVCCNSFDGTYLNLYLKRAASTADILDPSVVRQFLDCTHETYLHSFKEDLASNTAGFFTDEPQYYRAATPYTPMILEYFKAQYNEDLLDSLGLLFVEKEGFESFRYRYWLGLQTLMLENFSKQVYEWCDSHGIQFTGHYVEEPSLGGQLMCCAGVMPFYEYEHIPGIDWLGPVTDNEISPRQLGSAACQLGKKQTLTETFGCCGWNISPADLRRIAGFQLCCGVNLICQHLLPYSDHGQRKKDYPAHFNPANPWIDAHFKDFNDQLSRLGYLLSESDEFVNVAMLHPIRSAYLTYQRGSDPYGIPISELDEPLRKACRTLSSRGIAYHFLDETLLEKYGFTKGAALGCGKCTYEYLIIPKAYTMAASTERLLRKYISSGGKVLLLDEKPSYLEGSPFDYDYLKSNCTLEMIANSQPFSIENTENELYYTFHRLEEHSFLFVQNASSTKSFSQTFHFTDKTRSFMALDLTTLQFHPMPLNVTLNKNEALLLFTSEKEELFTQTNAVVSLNFENARAEFSKNFLTLDQVSFSKNGKDFSKPMLCNALCSQLLEERYEGMLWLRYHFQIRKMPTVLSLYAEKDPSARYFINGRELLFTSTLKEDPSAQQCEIISFVQPGDNIYEVQCNWYQSEATYYALFGEGVTESLKNCIAYDSEIEPVYLGGDFGVYSDYKFAPYQKHYLLGTDFYIDAMPEKISEPVTDGLTFFRGSLSLTKHFVFQDPNIRVSLEGNYLFARLYVNGQDAGELLFENTLDISPFAKAGDNVITAVFSIGNRNLLGPFHSSEDELFVSPGSFAVDDLTDQNTEKTLYRFHTFYSKKSTDDLEDF